MYKNTDTTEEKNNTSNEFLPFKNTKMRYYMMAT